MIMKKYFLSLGLIAAAAFTLTNCTKEIDQPDQAPESAGFPFEITASTAVTKTVAGDEYATNWANNDALSVFHAEAGSTEYGANDEFTYTADNKFTGTLKTALEASKSYDWYAFYPYNKNYTFTNNKIGYTTYGAKCSANAVSTAPKQDGNDSMAHLAGELYPLYGEVSGVAAAGSVSVEMNHLMSVVELEVTNSSTEPLTVTEIQFVTPEYIVGSFYYNTSDGTYEISQDGGTYNSKTARLSVVADPIAVGSKAKFYIGIIPVTLTEGEVSMTVVTDKGTQTKTKTLTDSDTDDIKFTAGKIKPMTFNYTSAAVVKTVSLPWTEDFGTTGSPSDLSNYTLVNGGSTTKLYNENSAGGTAPEILISKGDGSMSVNVELDGASGYLTLFFKSKFDHISVTSSTEGVTPEKVSKGTWHINVPAGKEILQLTLTNTSNSDNERVDDISLSVGKKSAQTLEFDKNEVSVTVGDDFTRPVLSGAETSVTYSSSDQTVATVDSSTGAVTIIGTGTTTITATAAETNEYFGASASYTLTVVEASTLYVFKTQKSSSNNAYANNYDVTIDDVIWNVPGNQNFDGYVRIGGKNLTNVTRVIYSKGSVTGDVKSVVMETNGISNSSLMVHSVVCKVYSSAAGAEAGDNTDLIATISNTDNDWGKSTPKTISFVNSSSSAWSNCYYRFEFTVSNSNTSSNYGIDLCKIEFKSN